MRQRDDAPADDAARRQRKPPLDVAIDVCARARAVGGRGLIVGGAVRDQILGRPITDYDVEVFGLSPDDLRASLDDGYRIDVVGEHFGVLKLLGHSVDVSVPRREQKTGVGHRAFDIDADPTMTPEEAARRRDFTINAISWDPLADEIIDPFGGRADLDERVLRAIDPVTFVEDELRVLRGMQFIARFELTPTPETLDICRTLTPEPLAKERLMEEWRKLILLGDDIKAGLDFLQDVGWLDWFPELDALVGCEQDPEWHPEGDVFVHTGHCMNAFARERVGDEHEDLIVGLAVLCHDFGKPATTEFFDGRWRSHNHDVEGIAPTRSFIARLTDQPLHKEVVPLVEAHLRPVQLHRADAGKSAIRRLAAKVGRLDRLVRVADADQAGRPPLPASDFPEGEWLLAQAATLDVVDRAPRPLLQGRHLIAEFQMEPGPAFGPLLKRAYEAQLDSEFETEADAIAWARAQPETTP